MKGRPSKLLAATGRTCVRVPEPREIAALPLTWDHLTAGRGHAASPAPRPPLAAEVLAGIVASLVTIAHCLSFSALIFSGELRDGLAAGLWGFMLATALASLAAAFITTLPPVLAGPRNPAIAVMSVMAAGIAAEIIAAGGTGARAAQHVLAALSVATVLTGLVLWGLGAFRLGQIVRFVPYPVIAGFLAASGWLLITGGFKVATGRPLDLGALSIPTGSDAARLAIAVLFAGLVQLLRTRGAGAAVLPMLFVGSTVLLDIVLWWMGERGGWFLTSSSQARPWSPLGFSAADVDWRVIARAAVEILSIVAVTVIALLLDISSLEVQRRSSADMDAEFRNGGLLHLALAPLGGLSVGVALNPSRLIDELGGTTRLAGLAGGLAVGLVLLSGLDISALVPTPLLAGLVIYLGAGVISEALRTSPAGRSWTELGLTVAIMLAIVRLGYLTGVVLGIVGACLLFAVRYSRIEPIRRHVTRAEVSSPVERSPELKALLAHEGRRIHLFWVTGFVFFGSANRIYEEIRAKTGEGADGRRRWVVLDLTGVSGIDSSAVLSFVKLANWARTANVSLALAGNLAAMKAELQELRLPALGEHVRRHAGRNEALEWCEEELINAVHLQTAPDDMTTFAAWLALELGAEAGKRLLERYLERRPLAPGEVVCEQGMASNSIEFIAMGSVAVTFTDATGRKVRVRRMAGRTVVGEMGFFRHSPRAASVVAINATTVMVLSRARYEALTQEDPDLARALLEFVVRALADRVEHGNREIGALL